MELLAPDVCLDDVYVEVGQGGSGREMHHYLEERNGAARTSVEL